MDEFKESLNNEDVKVLYETYLKLVSILEELYKNIKELPPKEEL